MSKAKSITEQIEEMQREVEALKGLKRAFNRVCKDEFGYESKKIHEMLKRCEMYDRRMQNNAPQRQGNQGVNERSE